MSDTQIVVALIDDDSVLVGIYKKAFESVGYKVLTAEDGAAGLALIKKKRPDVVVLDVLMPEMDGFAVLEAIKKDSNVTATPVLFFTSLGGKADVQKGLALGAASYVLKTHTNPTEMIQHIHTALLT